jgi:hypothetical protein
MIAVSLRASLIVEIALNQLQQSRNQGDRPWHCDCRAFEKKKYLIALA